MTKQFGLGLIELLIAMALSLVLMLGILQVFIGNQKSFALMRDMGNLQENGRVAISLIAESVRTADHWGGLDARQVDIGVMALSASPGACNAAWVFDRLDGVRGYDGGAQVGDIADLPVDCISKNDYVAKSDLLMLRYADGRSLASDADIGLSRRKKQYFVRLTTGLSAYVFKGLNSDEAIARIPYIAGTYNMQYRAELYFLRPCNFKVRSKCLAGLPTLTRLTLSGDKFTQQALVEGVEQLQFDYGVDTNNDKKVDVYQGANMVVDWASVMSVRINLISRSLDIDTAINEMGREYLMLGDMAQTGQGHSISSENKNYHHKQYQREIYIRNRERL